MEPGSFRPAWWLPGPHLQTIWSWADRRVEEPRMTREFLATPDGDEIVLDHLDGEPGRPRVVLLHGLEGSSRSSYIRRILARLEALGWSATAMNFRSCARVLPRSRRIIPNRRARLYHSGETADFDFVVETLARRIDGAPLFAAGFSLGGNVLLKWLGEHPGSTRLAAAVAISAPYDLAASSRYLESGAGRFYVAPLLRTLRRKALSAARRFPEAAERIDIERTMKATTFFEFDDAATAPLHDFAGADDYYEKSNSLRFLPRITLPALCLSARDDPFLPAEALDRVQRSASPSMSLAFTNRGGHVGFVEGRVPGRGDFWAERAAATWLEAVAGRISQRAS